MTASAACVGLVGGCGFALPWIIATVGVAFTVCKVVCGVLKFRINRDIQFPFQFGKQFGSTVQEQIIASMSHAIRAVHLCQR
jgi:hypothetical protein